MRSAKPGNHLNTTGILQNMETCILSSSHYVIPKSKAFFVLFTFKVFLRHQLVTLFRSGAPPPKKNPGSSPWG